MKKKKKEKERERENRNMKGNAEKGWNAHTCFQHN
jgi:hypothetical protein